MANPWMKFYTSDWRSDPRLKMCSAGARGVWIEMICLMHEATPYGHLLIHGQTPNEAQLASLTGIPLAELEHYVSELEQMGVFSKTKEGVIYSRKLVRMASRSAKMRKNGKKGGNPKLLKSSDNPDLLNQMDKGRDNPQKPEARSQIYEDTNVSSLSCAKRPPSRFQEFWDQYPHRNGAKKGRAKAEARYARHVKAGVSEQEIIGGAMRYVSDRMVIDGYAKDPTTWLNNKGWQDDIEPADNRNRHDRPQQRGSGGHGSGTVDAFAEVARRRAQGGA